MVVSAQEQQIVALTGLVGTLVGVLQLHGVFGVAEADGLFRMVDHMLPEDAAGAGLRALADVRLISQIVARKPG